MDEMDEDDGYRNDAQRNQAALELWSRVDCSGASCCGWVLSSYDVWSRCRGADCGGRGSPHPEEEGA
jgi:hypothetical protein